MRLTTPWKFPQKGTTTDSQGEGPVTRTGGPPSASLGAQVSLPTRREAGGRPGQTVSTSLRGPQGFPMRERTHVPLRPVGMLCCHVFTWENGPGQLTLL